MSQRKILYSMPELCTGCHMCELMCSLSKTGTINTYLARVRVSHQEEKFSCFPVLCRHCDPAPCQQACPVPEAMTMDEVLRVVIINESACIKCGACAEACPFGAIQVGPNNEILKCDLCGGDPVCVKYCPPRPENSLPELPWPKDSCLKYIEPRQVNTININKHILTRKKGQAVKIPESHWQKRFQLAPQFAKQAEKHKKTTGE